MTVNNAVIRGHPDHPLVWQQAGDTQVLCWANGHAFLMPAAPKVLRLLEHLNSGTASPVQRLVEEYAGTSRCGDVEVEVLPEDVRALLEMLVRLRAVTDTAAGPWANAMLCPDDIFIVTYPRSGTTWLQMILYQLTTDGSMDFPHINAVCPWFERSLRLGWDLDALPSPRVFKSHLPFDEVPQGPGRYLYVARDGKDVAVSYFHFYQSHLGFQGNFAEFFKLFLRGEVRHGSWFEHVKGWYQHRGDPNVLFLRYEDLLRDPEGGLRRISAFCGLEIDPGRFPALLERCSFAFMKRHESQFDHLTGVLWEQGCRPNAFLRRGRAGGWKEELRPDQGARFDTAVREHLGPWAVAFGNA
jgi:hypothetical protein